MQMQTIAISPTGSSERRTTIRSHEMASTIKHPNSVAWQPASSGERPQSSASQLTAGLRAAAARGLFNLPKAPSTIDSLTDARTQHLSSTWPPHSSSQSRQRGPHSVVRPTSTGNPASTQASSNESALDEEIRRSNDHHETLRASALWERYKTANTAPYRQTFSRSDKDDEFWKQVSSNYSVW